MEKYETIIVGAGPAGLSVARVLAEAGKDVLVLERKKIIGPSICAGGLTIKDMEFIPKDLVEKRLSEKWWNQSILTNVAK